ncbi:hypothetical protein Slin_3369 [Spirosoma linguale DSM 74]|uniref:Uncharacterized protein n=1 Tax=Spirosoma linguale (strain ATCC 33905 / DSM 74 / LMG 10896 / Claus 1) TaxID=504472 RepID=D2QP69_SPILD|nr:hypothetical protein Slin_3369 [Spirosoma linguale DSM 74]
MCYQSPFVPDKSRTPNQSGTAYNYVRGSDTGTSPHLTPWPVNLQPSDLITSKIRVGLLYIHRFDPDVTIQYIVTFGL